MTDRPEDSIGDRELALIFNAQIRPGITGTRRDHPVVLWVGGPPAAGKSSVQSALMARLGLSEAFPLDGDDLLFHHPRYVAMHQKNDLQASFLVGENVGGRWWTRAARILRILRIDAVISAPLGGAGWAAERFKEFRQAGVRNEVAIMATHEALSWQGNVERYGQMKLASPEGIGRWVLPELIDGMYDPGVLATADMVFRTKAADALHIGVRGGALIHTNELVDGRWTLDVLPSQVIEAWRNRPWSVPESAQVLQKQGELRAWLKTAEWQPLLDTIDRKAHPVISPMAVMDDRQLTSLRDELPQLVEKAALRAEVAQARAAALAERQSNGTNEHFLTEMRRGGAPPEEVDQTRSDLNRERWAASVTAGNLTRHAGDLSTLNGRVRGEQHRRIDLAPDIRKAEESGRQHHQAVNPTVARLLPAEPTVVVLTSPAVPAPPPTIPGQSPTTADAATPAQGRKTRGRAIGRSLDQAYELGDSTPKRRPPSPRGMGSPGI